MPMLVRLRWLVKAGPFLRRLPAPLPQKSRSAQHTPHADRTHRHDVGVQHHECQPSVAFQRILQVERNDRLLLPLLQPKVPGNPTVMLIDLAGTTSRSRSGMKLGHLPPADSTPALMPGHRSGAPQRCSFAVLFVTSC
jgi:hypothetical protein